MFTGIIEVLGEIQDLKDEGTNRYFQVAAAFPDAIRVDQSIAHDGVCLTVTELYGQTPDKKTLYSVTAVEETLRRSKLGDWKRGDSVNLERSLRMGDRLDGHFVQGHVDDRGEVLSIDPREGSWNIRIAFNPIHHTLLVDKGSICVDGVSLTIVKAEESAFTVTIIPYTWEHTCFQYLKPGDSVNLEFDVLGKYIAKLYAR